MGDWEYYISFMPMKDLVERVTRLPQVYKSERLQELLQRDLQGRRQTEIRKYLLAQKERFFNALVIGTSGSNLKWQGLPQRKAKINPDLSLGANLRGSQGFIILEGKERLFTLDGQHRVEGIRQALSQEKHDPSLDNEQVAVVLVRGVASTSYFQDKPGFERTRRVFSTLNRYAKLVSTAEIIALDEDDISAIVTRRLVNEYDLFTHKKISIRRTTAIPPSDKISVTSLVMLYKALDFYFGGLLQGEEKRIWSDYKRFRPEDRTIKSFSDKAIEFWDTYCEKFPPLKEAKESQDEEEVAGKYRNEGGGHYLFRPVGLLISAKTVRRLIAFDKISMEKAVTRLARIPVELSKAPWAKLIWDPGNNRIVNDNVNLRAMEKYAYYSLGGNIANLGTKEEPETEQHLKEEIAGLLRMEPTKVTLVKYLDQV